MRSLWWVRPNTWWEDATGAWDAALWLGEATAAYRCSHVLSRCSTSPPSNWQMALDARWFNGLCEVFFFFFSLPQPAISRDICNDLARRTAESGRWEQHFLMGGSAIVTDFGGNLGTQRYYFWVNDNNFKLPTSQGKTIYKKKNHLMLFSPERLQRIKQHSITGYHLCQRTFLTFKTPKDDVSSCVLS